MIDYQTSLSPTGATIVKATGRLDMVAAPQLKNLVAVAVSSNDTPVVVDLSGVVFMDSSGLGALISGLRTTRQSGSDLRIAGATTQVLTVLKMTNIDRIIRPYADVEEALRGG